jgi:hypothetical protein
MVRSTEWNILPKFELTMTHPIGNLCWHRIINNTAVAGRRQTWFASQGTDGMAVRKTISNRKT